MELYMMNRQHGRMILASVEKGPLFWPSITEDGVTRLKEYVELTPAEAIQVDCDIKAINIILQGLPTEIYALHYPQCCLSIRLSGRAYDSICDELNTAVLLLWRYLSRDGSMALTEYLSEVQQETIQNSNSSAQQDVIILSVFEQLTTQVTHCTNVNLEYKSVNQDLTTELDRYKEKVKDFLESKPKLVMDENTILNMDTIVISPDSDETLMLCEESRSKLLLKEQDPMVFIKGNVDDSKVKIDMDEIETLNIELEHRVTKLVAENEHLKQTYKQLYDSIKPKRVQSKEQELKGRTVEKDAIENPTSVIQMYHKDNMEPITPKLLNKRTAHSSYIKHTQEEALVLRDIDLLSHISRSCPSINNFGPQIVEVTPRKKDKKVRSKDFLSTSASGSQPLSNT
ncbi:hypothetical protein Tco_0007859 [Tanacetum coccineum]